MFKNTKIVATIGPACADEKTLTQMVKAGVNVARLNFSHGTYPSHKKLINNIRRVEKTTKIPVAILQDLQGPKIRLGILPDKGLEIKSGVKVTFDTAIKEYKGKELPIAYPGLQKFLKVGQHFLLDDGHMEVKIEKITGTKIFCLVIEGELLTSHKGLNFPESVLKIPSLSKKDIDDLEFGVKAGVEFVALSFVHTAADILRLRALIIKFEKKLKIKKQAPILIIAKIEQHEAVENIDEIIEASDGIMVARGDLGLETPEAGVPIIQKMIINKARLKAKIVIVATQMLDSMQHNRLPTRAEVSDVANAVLDHTDAVMLSNETASGEYPVLTVKTMAKIVITTEASPFDDLPLAISSTELAPEAVAVLSSALSHDVGAKLIVTGSFSGLTGRLISHVRPQAPILVATSSLRVQRQLNLSWGVWPIIMPQVSRDKVFLEKIKTLIKSKKITKKGDKVVIVSGDSANKKNKINSVVVIEI